MAFLGTHDVKGDILVQVGKQLVIRMRGWHAPFELASLKFVPVVFYVPASFINLPEAI